METLLATFAVAWAAVSIYAAWLAVENGRLARRLEQLEDVVREQQGTTVSRAKVA